MKKFIIFLFLISIFSNASIYPYLQDKFNADIIQKSYENNKEIIKKYELRYYLDKVEIEIIYPEINKGEIYTYKDSEKYLYSPRLKQEVKQSISESDESIYSILNTISKIKDSKNTIINNKKFIFENNKLKEILSNNYKILFLSHKNSKPNIIKFVSNDIEIEYYINYK